MQQFLIHPEKTTIGTSKKVHHNMFLLECLVVTRRSKKQNKIIENLLTRTSKGLQKTTNELNISSMGALGGN
jgi:hypothetical protein